MFNRTDIPLTPSDWVGCLAALPWLALALFNFTLTLIYGGGFLVLFAISLAAAAYHWHLIGRLAFDKSILSLMITQSGLVAERKDGKQFAATVKAESRLYSTLVILKLAPIDSTYGAAIVVLWPHRKRAGNVDPDRHRQLKAWLRLAGSDDTLQQPHQ